MNLSGIKCIVFDADNTLYKTRSIAKTADLAGLAILAQKIGKAPEELYEEFSEIVDAVKKSPEPKVRNRKYSYSILAKKYVVDVVDAMFEAFKKAVLDNLELTPGTLEFLNYVKDKELYVVTEDDLAMATAKLKTLQIFDRFKKVITSDEVGVMKPAEKYYTSLLRLFKPEEVLVVGDNYEKDLALPEKLGIKTYLVDSEKIDFKNIIQDNL